MDEISGRILDKGVQKLILVMITAMMMVNSNASFFVFFGDIFTVCTCYFHCLVENMSRQKCWLTKKYLLSQTNATFDVYGTAYNERCDDVLQPEMLKWSKNR